MSLPTDSATGTPQNGDTIPDTTTCEIATSAAKNANRGSTTPKAPVGDHEPGCFGEGGRLPADQQEVTIAATEFERECPADALPRASDYSVSIGKVTPCERP